MKTHHLRPLWLSGLTAIGGSTVANLIALYLLRPFVIDQVHPLHALSMGPVATLTVVGALAAIIVYAILRRFLVHPNKTFVVISILVFLISLVPDYLILGSTNPLFAGANTASVGLLMLMHAIAAVAIVFPLVKLTRPLHFSSEFSENPPPLF